jgi:hypothetical protein
VAERPSPEVEVYGWYGEPTEIERDHPCSDSESNYHAVLEESPIGGHDVRMRCRPAMDARENQVRRLCSRRFLTQAHKPDESLKVDEFIQYIRIVAYSLIDWFEAWKLHEASNAGACKPATLLLIVPDCGKDL